MNDDFSHITRHCFINAPYDQLRAGLLETFLEHRLCPEIGLEGNCLYETDREDFVALAKTLREHGLPCTLHAPFFDLSPAAFDPRIREVSRAKLRLAFALIPVFRPRSIVCHLDFEERRQGRKFDPWLEIAVETWTELGALATEHGTMLMLENTFEQGPEAHRRILEAIDSPHLGYCLDVGHVMAFAGTSWQPWLAALQPWLGQVHLHDNDGKSDAHIAIGRGVFPFQELIGHLRENGLDPLVTLEPHSRDDLWQSLKAITAMGLLPIRG